MGAGAEWVVGVSLERLQEILCRSAVDPAFLLLLGRAPHQALAGFELSEAERALLSWPPARSLEQLALRVEAWRYADSDAALPSTGGRHDSVSAPAVP